MLHKGRAEACGGGAVRLVPRPCPPAPAAGIELGPGEWVLLAPSCGPPPLDLLQRQVLATPAGGRADRALPVEFCLAGELDPLLGRAVLYARPGRAVVYCAQGSITERGAAVLSVLASRAVRLAEVTGTLSVRVTTEDHAALAGLHPGAVRPGIDGAAVCACAELLSAGLAPVAGFLLTEHLRVRGGLARFRAAPSGARRRYRLPATA